MEALSAKGEVAGFSQDIVDKAKAFMKRHTSLFEEGINEAPLAGFLERGGEKIFIQGVVDRVCFEKDRLVVMEYKSGGGLEEKESLPPEHVAQVATYRALVACLSPKDKVVACVAFPEAPPHKKDVVFLSPKEETMFSLGKKNPKKNP